MVLPNYWKLWVTVSLNTTVLYIFLSQISPLNAYKKKKKEVPWLSVCWSISSFLSSFTRGPIPCAAASPSGHSAHAQREFLFSGASSISFPFVCAVKKASDGVGRWKWWLAAVFTFAALRADAWVTKALALCGFNSCSPAAEEGRESFAKRPFPRVLCGKGSSKAQIRYRV